MKKQQQGATFLGMLFIAACIVFVAIIGVKMVPSYIEFFSIKKILVSMRNAGEMKEGPKEIRAAFDRRASIDNITSIKGDELEISKDGEEALVTATYSVKVPLMGNVSACMDFKTASSGN